MTTFLEAGILAFSAVIGGICAVSDIRRGIIPNRVLLIGLAGGIPFHLVFLLSGSAFYYPTWLINMLIADALAFVMYYNRLWAAGDAKLFIVLYYLFPPLLLDVGLYTYSVVPYIFIFLPALVWILADTVISLIRREPRKAIPLQPKKILKNVFTVMIESTALYCVISLIPGEFTAENGLFVSLLMMCYAYFCSSNRTMKRWYVILIHAVIAAVPLFLGRGINVLPDWRSLLTLILVIGIQHFVSLYNYRKIPTADVKAGMILSADTVLSFQKSRVQGLPADPSEELTAKIDEEQAATVRRWEQSAYGAPTVWTVRKVPFGSMIALGFVLWAIVRIAG